MKIQINRIVRMTKNEGFGNRYCIWMQGCSIRCRGCMNSHMWSFDEGIPMNVSEILGDIQDCTFIEGVTLLGGEPFDQSISLAELVRQVHDSGLSVIVFTGYTLEYLIGQNDPSIQTILDNTDLLIDGPYIEECTDFSRPWIGSRNQRFLFLSDRYCEADLKKQKTGSRYELRICKDGTITVNGIGDLQCFSKMILFQEGKCEKTENNNLS